jgi:Calx-beta domain
MGTNGLIYTGETTVPIPPPAGPRQTDLQIGARLQSPVWGTNQFLWVEVSITNRSEWYASRSVLQLRHSEGLVLRPPSPPERLELTPLVGETNITFLFQTTAPGPQWIRAEVVDPLPDASQSDNVAELRWETPPPPVLSVADQEVYEGGAVALVLSTPAPSDLDVSFEAVPNSAQSEDVNSGTLVAQFRAGEVRGWLFAVRQDENSELNETFHLRFLGGAVRPSRTESVVTILDDDQPSIRPADLRIREGDAGTLKARWPVHLSRASTTPVEVGFRVGAGSASSGSDFAARTGRLRFEPGDTVRYVTVPILGDTLFEPDESVMLDLVEGWGGQVSIRQGTLIVENDDPMPPPSLTLRRSSGPDWILGFPSSAGSNYRIQFRTDLGQGEWDFEPGVWVGTGGEVEIPVSASPERTRWYRLWVE